MIPPLVPKNLFKDTKKLSLKFLQESISYTPYECSDFRKFSSDFSMVCLCLANLRV